MNVYKSNYAGKLHFYHLQMFDHKNNFVGELSLPYLVISQFITSPRPGGLSMN